MKYQTKYYIMGTVCLVVAMLFATILPPLIKHFNFIYVEDYMFVAMKFFMLVACGAYYLFAPKYFKEQLLNILIALLAYILYVRLYNLIF